MERPLTACAFFRTVVQPTVQEFLDSPTDLRRGRLAAIVLYHTIDYWECDHGRSGVVSSKTHSELIVQCPDYLFIRDVADASKHGILRAQKTVSRSICTSSQVSKPPGLFNAPFGYGVFAEASFVHVELNDGTKRQLAQLVQTVAEFWRVKLEA